MRLRLPLVFAGMAIVLPAAHGAQYPEKSVRVIVGLAAGGGTDISARVLAQKLSETLGQSFIVDNRPGAGSRTRAVNRVPACGM